MDIPAAEFLLAVVVFLAGTATPALYRRFFHQGVSVKALRFRVGAAFQTTPAYLFATVLKAANATSSSILIDEIRMPDVTQKTPSGTRVYRQEIAVLADVTTSRKVTVPTWRAPDQRLDVLPVILSPNAANVYLLEVHYTYPGPPDPIAAGDAFAEAFEILPVEIRINGVFRRYRVDTARSQPLVGYEFRVDLTEGWEEGPSG